MSQSKRSLVDLDAVEKVDKARTAGEWFRDQDGAFRTTIEDELGTRERTIHASRYPGEEGKTWAGEVDAAFVIMASKTMGPICEALRELDTVAEVLKHALQRAHEDLVAGRADAAKNRILVALSMVVPS